MLANRVSFALGLKGPSMAIDTACSSSLVALDVACGKLRDGSCDTALVGGINLMLSSTAYSGCCAAHMLSADGLCKTFDVSADGYGRGEGCGVVVLKRMGDVTLDDTVLGVIRGSAVNHDGRSASLTAPNGPSQVAVIEHALRNAGVGPEEVTYVETHGTGTALGDPIEFGALKSAYGAPEARRHPLVLGAVKSNIGHLEGAAGIAGLIKALLVLRHECAPPVMHRSEI